MADQADILVVPGLESGNTLARQLEFMAEAQVAGIVLDARVPVIPAAPQHSPLAGLAGLASCALAALLVRQSLASAATASS